jgi:hypothetical protein
MPKSNEVKMCSMCNEGMSPSFSHEKTIDYFHDDLKLVFCFYYLWFHHDLLDCGYQCDCLPISAAITRCDLWLVVVMGLWLGGCCYSIPLSWGNHPGYQVTTISCFEEILLCPS